jgi:DNA ligase N terminus
LPPSHHPKELEKVAKMDGGGAVLGDGGGASNDGDINDNRAVVDSIRTINQPDDNTSDDDDGGVEDDDSWHRRDLRAREYEEDYSNADGGYDDDDDDDPVAEGEEDPTAAAAAAKAALLPRPEPSEAQASAVKFSTIARSLEVVSRAVADKKGWSETEKLERVLPAKFLQTIDEHNANVAAAVAAAAAGATTATTAATLPETIFPILRLLCPDQDGTRQFAIQEAKLGVMYVEALGLVRGTTKYNMIVHFSDPQYVSHKQGCGDLSRVVETVLAMTKSVKLLSDCTVGHVNQALDEFAQLSGRARSIGRTGGGVSPAAATATPPNNKQQRPKLNDLRTAWLKNLDQGQGRRRGLSPLEHKWLCKILLRRMNFGLVRTSAYMWAFCVWEVAFFRQSIDCCGLLSRKANVSLCVWVSYRCRLLRAINGWYVDTCTDHMFGSHDEHLTQSCTCSFSFFGFLFRPVEVVQSAGPGHVGRAQQPEGDMHETLLPRVPCGWDEETNR